MACGTTVQYGFMIIQNVETHEFTLNVVRDPAGVNQMYSHYMIAISGYVHEDAALFASFGVSALTTLEMPDGSNEASFNTKSTQDKLQIVHRYLAQFRRDFLYDIDGNEVLRAAHDISANTPRAYADVDNGPKTSNIVVEHVIGRKAFRVRCTFEICKIACALPDPTPPLVSASDTLDSRSAELIEWIQDTIISHTWTQQVSRNDNFQLTRMIQGRIRVSHRLYWKEGGTILREACVPPLYRGYQRLKLDIVKLPDGLTLQYAFIDQQQEAAPPMPAIKWAASHSASIRANEKQEDDGEFHTINATVIGAPGTNKFALFLAALSIVDTRMNFDRVAVGTDAVFLTGIDVVDILHENAVQINATFLRKMPAGYWLDLWVGNLDLLPPVDPFKRDAQGNIIFDVPIPPAHAQPQRNPDRTYVGKYNRDQWPNPLPHDTTIPAEDYWAQALMEPCSKTPKLFPAGVNDQNAQPHEAVYPPLDTGYSAGTTDVSVYYRQSATDAEISAYPPTNSAATRSADGQQDNVTQYTHFELESRYFTDYGVTQAPISGNGYISQGQNTCVITKTHQPIARRVIWVRANRIGAVPKLPVFTEQFDDTNNPPISHYLSESEIMPTQASLGADGKTLTYGLEARFVYWMSRPIALGDHMDIGKIPMMTPSSASISPSDPSHPRFTVTKYEVNAGNIDESLMMGKNP